MSELCEIEKRLQLLEEKISPQLKYGKDVEILDPLKKIHSMLSTLAEKRERFKNVFKKVPEILECLDPEFISSQEMDVSAKRDYILAMESEIRSTVERLSKIDQSQGVLDSHVIANCSSNEGKLHKMNIDLLEQLSEAKQLDENLKQLLTNYNVLVQNLSEHFTYLDQVITELELKKMKEAG